MPDKITTEEQRAIDEWMAKRKPTWVAPGVGGDFRMKHWGVLGREASIRARQERARRFKRLKETSHE